MRRGLLVAAAGLLLGVGSAGAARPANELAPLVLPKGQLGKLAQRLQVELKSGTTSNARAADDSFDPNDSEASVKKAGRGYGYTLLYGDVGWTGLRTGHGLLDVGSSLDLFKSEQHATQYALKSLRDAQAAQGKNLQGTVIERVRIFRITGLGPGAVGLEVTQRLGTHRLYGTFIDFQLANILCEALINRADAQNMRRQVADIAKKLRDRIVTVVAKKQNPTPAPLPRPLGTAKPGPGAPDLSAMVPTNGDLKGKAGVDTQGFVPDDDAIASYVREYRLPPNSGLFSLRATAALERTAREASGRLFLLRSVITGPDAGDSLAHQLAPGATAVHLDGTQSAKLGDESFATAVSFKAGGQRLRVVIVYERRERIIGSIILLGTAKKLQLAGAMFYAKQLDKRIKSALNPALVA